MTARSLNTPGPWAIGPIEVNKRLIISPNGAPFGAAVVAHVLTRTTADDYLIAAAPDHADIGWAMCVGAGRWEPWGDGRGEFIVNGLRFFTELDMFGIPRVTPELRAEIQDRRMIGAA